MVISPAQSFFFLHLEKGEDFHCVTALLLFSVIWIPSNKLKKGMRERVKSSLSAVLNSMLSHLLGERIK